MVGIDKILVKLNDATPSVQLSSTISSLNSKLQHGTRISNASVVMPALNEIHDTIPALHAVLEAVLDEN